MLRPARSFDRVTNFYWPDRELEFRDFVGVNRVRDRFNPTAMLARYGCLDGVSSGSVWIRLIDTESIEPDFCLWGR